MSPPVAPPGWSRWLVPPAALSVHLSIGQAYAWSVFKPPLESALDLSGTQSALPFQLGIVMLGLSAAFGGTLVERRGPRWAMTVALICFSSGFLLSALGAATEQYWLIVFGYGFVGGIGLEHLRRPGRGDQRAAAEAHDGDAGGHAGPVREPFDERRDG